LTLLVDALVVVGGLLVGRLVARTALARARSRSRRRLGPEEPIESIDVFTVFPCRLGDVLVRRAERDEAWLAGALVFSEDRPVAALFIAPEAVQDRAVYARAARSEVAWLAPISPGALAPRGEPPLAIELEGVRFERTRRLPVHMERLGSGAPEIGGRTVIAEYSGPGLERLVIVAGEGAVLAWRGVALSEREYDVLPAGAQTRPDPT
jgi:hypothetical protein